MVVDVKPEVPVVTNTNGVRRLIGRYNHAKAIKDLWTSTFEECYEFALPQRESFYTESIGRRRTDRIFDETAVVGVQEFASRLQAGIVPNYARWADFVAGSEIPKEDEKQVNLLLDEVTEYVFEILQNSNFSQEVHETFLDCAVGTGVLLVEEGDAVQPVRFRAIPLPQIYLDAGHDDKIDYIFRNRKIKFKDILIAYPAGTLSEKMQMDMEKMPDKECDVVEIVYRDYSNTKEEEYKFCAISEMYEHKIVETTFKGLGSNPYIIYRWSKCAGEVYGRGPLELALQAIKTFRVQEGSSIYTGSDMMGTDDLSSRISQLGRYDKDSLLLKGGVVKWGGSEQDAQEAQDEGRLFFSHFGDADNPNPKHRNKAVYLYDTGELWAEDDDGYDPNIHDVNTPKFIYWVKVR